MPKAVTISTAAKPDDVDKAHASAKKALSTLGLRIDIKKPDPAKLAPAMAKSKAEFKLGGDSNLVKVTVEAGNYTSVLGFFDLKAERDAQRKVALMKTLVEQGILPKSELDDAQKELAKASGVDPKVAANLDRQILAVTKELDAANLEKDMWADVKKVDDIFANERVLKEVHAFAKKNQWDENLEFLQAVHAKKKVKELRSTFLDNGAPKQVNLDGEILAAAQGGDIKPAVDFIVSLVKNDALHKFRNAKAAEMKPRTTALEKKLKDLEGEKAKLGK